MNNIITPRLCVEPWQAKIFPPHSDSHKLIVCGEEYVSCRKITSDFCWRLIDLTIGLKRPSHFLRVSKEVKADLFTWQQFFQEYNGKSFFLNKKWENSVSLQLFTDAAGAHGFGAVFGSHWCYGEWPKEWLGQNIAISRILPNCSEFTVVG